MGEVGFEPTTSVLKTKILPLNYSPIKILAGKGIEPFLKGYEPSVLPVHYPAQNIFIRRRWDLNPHEWLDKPTFYQLNNASKNF